MEQVNPKAMPPFGVEKGLARECIMVGMFVTISASKIIMDRSYGQSIWEVIAVTRDAVLAKATKHIDGFWLNRGPVIFKFTEREFYDAEPFVTALEEVEQQEPRQCLPPSPQSYKLGDWLSFLKRRTQQ